MDTVKARNSKNLVLNLLSNEEFEEISPKLTKVDLLLGDILNNPHYATQQILH